MGKRIVWILIGALLALPTLAWAGEKAGFEVQQDLNIAAGNLAPGGSYIVQIVKLQDLDEDSLPVNITGLAVFQDLNGSATVAPTAPPDLTSVEVLWGSSPSGPWTVLFRIDAANPGTGPLGWDPNYFVQGPPLPTAPRGVNLQVPDDGTGYLAVRVTVTATPTVGNVVRPALAVWCREGTPAEGQYHLRIAVDGTEEVIGPQLYGQNAGFECVSDIYNSTSLVDGQEGYGVLNPGDQKLAMAFQVRDNDPDNNSVRITAFEIDFWHQFYGKGVANPAARGAGTPGGYWANDGANDITEVWIKNSNGIIVGRASFNGTTWNGSGVTGIDAGAFRVTFPNSNWSTVYTVPDDGTDTFYIEVWVSDPIQTTGHIIQPTVNIYHEEGPAVGAAANTFNPTSDIIRSVADGKAQAIGAWPTTWYTGSTTGLEAVPDQATSAGTIPVGVPTIVQTVYLRDLDTNTTPLLIQTMSVTMDYVRDGTPAPGPYAPPPLNLAPSPTGAIARIEILKDGVVIAEWDGIAPDTMRWAAGTWFADAASGYTPISINDETAATLQVRLTLDPAVFDPTGIPYAPGTSYGPGEIVRTAMDIVATEPPGWGATTVTRYAVDGCDEYVGPGVTGLGLEVVADRGVRYDDGYIGRGSSVVTAEFELKDQDADNFPVIVTALTFYLDDFNAHDVGVQCIDIDYAQFLDSAGNVIAEVPANSAFWPCGVQTFTLTGIGWVIPDDASAILKLKFTIPGVATLGHIIRAGVQVTHTEGGTAFTKTVYDGPAEEIGTPPAAPGPSPLVHNLPAGWNLVSIPLASTVNITGWTPPLYRWNPGAGSYDSLTDPNSMAPQYGYWLYANSGGATMEVTGSEVTSDVTVNLPDAGWQMVSAPWGYPRSAIRFTLGGDTKTWDEAVVAGWIADVLWGYTPGSGYQLATVMDPWQGYWLLTRVDGLTMTLRYADRTSGAAPELAPRAVPEGAPVPPAPPVPQAATGELVVANFPNPVTDVNTTVFRVLGPMAAMVEEIRVRIFDLSGRLVYEGTAAGAELVWHTDDLAGRYLANGVYLYQVQVKVAGNWITTELKKLAIYR